MLTFALNNPIRRQILHLLDGRDLELSLDEMADATSVGLSTLSFHARVLLELGVARRTRAHRLALTDSHLDEISTGNGGTLTHP